MTFIVCYIAIQNDLYCSSCLFLSKISSKEEVWCDTASVKFFLSFNLSFRIICDVFLTCVNPRGQLYKIRIVFSTQPQRRH